MHRLRVYSIYIRNGKTVPWVTGQWTQYLPPGLFCQCEQEVVPFTALQLMSVGVKGWRQCLPTWDCKYRNNWAAVWMRFSFLNSKREVALWNLSRFVMKSQRSESRGSHFGSWLSVPLFPLESTVCTFSYKKRTWCYRLPVKSLLVLFFKIAWSVWKYISNVVSTKSRACKKGIKLESLETSGHTGVVSFTCMSSCKVKAGLFVIGFSAINGATRYVGLFLSGVCLTLSREQPAVGNTVNHQGWETR